MELDLPATLRLVSHELRSPLGVIQGYLRMLSDGRVNDSMRPHVVEQMQRAALRLAAINQQMSEVARWVVDPPGQGEDVPLGVVLRQIGERSSRPVLVASPPGDHTPSVRTLDLAALAAAGVALVEVVTRRSGPAAAVTLAAATDADLLHLWASPTASPVGPAPVGPARDRRPVDLKEGGIGLLLVVAAAVVEAHGGQLWQSATPLAYGFTVHQGARQ